MKKLLSLCLTLMLALSLAVPAAAANTSGGVAVQVNGEDVVFSGASPEVANGRTMVPMRAVLEALGATVEYNTAAQTVTATLGSTVLHHVIGTDIITLSEEKKTEDSLGTGAKLTMDTRSYVKNGSTMVPLRFFSQALGYEVYWDAGARTAVVINKDALVSSIDKNFTILNDIQAKAPANSGNTAMYMKMKGELKLLDGSADTPIPFSSEMSALYSDKAMNITGTMDLSAIAQLPDAADDPSMAALAPMLQDMSFEMICGEAMWINMPMLVSLLQDSGEVPAGSDVWIKAGDFDMSALTDASTTIGSMLYDAIAYADAEMPVLIYDDVKEAGVMAQMLLGDAAFTKNGDGYSWQLDEKTSALLAQAIGETPDSFSLTMDMEVKAGMVSSFSMDLKTDAVSMSLSGTASDTASAVKCQLTIPEACEVSVECNANIAASSKAPVTAPPAGADVIDMSDSLNSGVGVIGGADGPTSIFTTKAA